MEPGSRLEELLEKYWQAETDAAEEAELKAYFSSDRSLDSHPAAALFSYFKQEQQVALNDTANGKIKWHRKPLREWAVPLMKAAAVLLIALSAVLLLLPGSHHPSAALMEKDTYQDPEKAYLETKKALLMISKKLNTGENYIAEIGKINRAEQLIISKSQKK